jgi:hypothetical protein
MAAERPVIVVGCARSGTTMLQLMLHAHRRIAIPPETRFVLSGYRQRRSFGDLREPAPREALARWIVDRRQTRFADLGLDAEQVAARIIAGRGTLGSAFGTVFQAYAERFGKPRWGDKRPAYLQNLDVITRLFPDAQIVNLIRDGRHDRGLGPRRRRRSPGRPPARPGAVPPVAVRGPGRRPAGRAVRALRLPGRGLRPGDGTAGRTRRRGRAGVQDVAPAHPRTGDHSADPKLAKPAQP